MGVKQLSVYLLTFLVIGVLVILVKRAKSPEQDIAIYTIGRKEYRNKAGDGQHEVSGLLHVAQVVKKASGDEDLEVVQVEFPKNGLDYIVMLVRVLNYNSKISKTELIREDKEDDNFWVLIEDGAIGTNTVTIEINSYLDIDADVEFYGYKKNPGE